MEINNDLDELYTIDSTCNKILIRYKDIDWSLGTSIAYNEIPVGMYKFSDLIRLFAYALTTSRTYSEKLSNLNNLNQLTPEKFTGPSTNVFKVTHVYDHQKRYVIRTDKKWYIVYCKNSILDSEAFSNLNYYPFRVTENSTVSFEHSLTPGGMPAGDTSIQCSFPKKPYLMFSEANGPFEFMYVERKTPRSNSSNHSSIGMIFYPGTYSLDILIDNFDYDYYLTCIPIVKNNQLFLKFQDVNRFIMTKITADKYNIKYDKITTETVQATSGFHKSKFDCNNNNYKNKCVEGTGDFTILVSELYRDNTHFIYNNKNYYFGKNIVNNYYSLPQAIEDISTRMNSLITDSLVPYEFLFEKTADNKLKGYRKFELKDISGIFEYFTMNSNGNQVSWENIPKTMNFSDKEKNVSEFMYPRYQNTFLPLSITTYNYNGSNQCSVMNLGNYPETVKDNKCVFYQMANNFDTTSINYTMKTDNGNYTVSSADNNILTIKPELTNKDAFYKYCTNNNHCPTGSYCASWRCRKLANGATCKNDSECNDSLCRNGICISRRYMSQCETNDDCLFGTCSNGHCDINPEINHHGNTNSINMSNIYSVPRSIDKDEYIFVNDNKVLVKSGNYTFTQLFKLLDNNSEAYWDIVDHGNVVYIIMTGLKSLDLRNSPFVARAIGFDPILIKNPKEYNIGMLFKFTDEYITLMQIEANRLHEGYLPNSLLSISEIPRVLSDSFSNWWNVRVNDTNIANTNHVDSGHRYNVSIEGKTMTISVAQDDNTSVPRKVYNELHSFVLVNGNYKGKKSFVEMDLFKNAPSYPIDTATTAEKQTSVSFELNIPSDTYNTKYCVATDRSCYCIGDCLCTDTNCKTKYIPEDFTNKQASNRFNILLLLLSFVAIILCCNLQSKINKKSMIYCGLFVILAVTGLIILH